MKNFINLKSLHLIPFDTLFKGPRRFDKITLVADIHIINGVIFELLKVLKDFKMHLRRTVLEIF